MGWTALARLVLAGSIACLMPALAAAQTYPTKPITLILPYAAGGNTDVIARTIAHRLEQRLGQNVIVETRRGAASVIGAAYVARAAPDGYTILIGTSTTMAINVSIYKSLPYDPTKDLVPLALVAGVPFMLVVNPDLPVRSVQDLVAVSKSRPGGLSYASNGHGGAAHLFAELLKGTLGIEMIHVPYKGLMPGLTDVVAGHVNMMFADFGTALPLVKDGKLRALGVSTTQRVGPAPEIPPLAEVGMPGFDASSWQMIIAPAGMPPPVLDRLNTELRAIMNEPEIRKDFADRGLVPLSSGSTEELQRFVKSEIVRWGKVVEQAGAAGSQ
jgi:tripartite-type tricarboxylate transporter receptor subunit TctC